MPQTLLSKLPHFSAIALSAAVLGGCGDDSGDTSDTDHAATTNVETTTGDTTDPTDTTEGPTTDPGTTEDVTTDMTTENVTTEDATTEDTTDTTDTTDDSDSETTEDPTEGKDPVMGFFVSSEGSPTGNLGGLDGADQRCQQLATTVGAGDRTWRAYLSAEKGNDDQPVHARDRIGKGPWYNAELVLVASNLEELHTLDGDHTLFLDENGAMVNGQWEGSPDPNEHDILTGSNKDGTVLAGMTCGDWTSEDPSLFAQVGHSDGLGPMMSDDEFYRPWNSVHENGGCHDTSPKGGAGRIYCFAAD